MSENRPSNLVPKSDLDKIGDKLSTTKIKILESMGMEWLASSAAAAAWEGNLERLRKYKEQHGDLNMKEDDPEWPGLAAWVKTQKVTKSNYDKGRKNAMPLTRQKLLEEVGIEWSKPVDKNRSTFDGRVEDVRKFVEEHGHLKVPQGPLRNWVSSTFTFV